MKTSGNLGFLFARITQDMESMSREAEDLVTSAAEQGEAIMKYHVETRGTAKSGKRGRVETGKMVNSISSDIVQASPESVTAKFGWLGLPPEHAQFQEPGFRHVGGMQVEGMYALADAFEEVVANLNEDVRRIGR